MIEVRCDGCGSTLSLDSERFPGERIQNRLRLDTWFAQGHRHACSDRCKLLVEQQFGTVDVWMNAEQAAYPKDWPLSEIKP